MDTSMLTMLSHAPEARLIGCAALGTGLAAFSACRRETKLLSAATTVRQGVDFMRSKRNYGEAYEREATNEADQ